MTTSKIIKSVIVVALTLLIWVWAYQASERLSNSILATINISRAIDPGLLVTFGEQFEQEFEVTLRGSASKIGDFEEKLNEGEKLEFVFNAETENMDSPGKHSLDLPTFLENSEKMKSLRLTVKSCSIETIGVTVEKLVEKPLTVECRDENDIPLPHETITPPRVDMFVPKNWDGDMLKAYVMLNQQAKAEARKSAIQRKPYVELHGERFYADDSVDIKLPPTETRRTDQILPGADIRIGYVFSAQTQGRYEVKLSNLQEIIERAKFSVTKEAISAYKDQQYQMLIEIHDDDINKDSVSREVVYNFPQKFIAINEIELVGTPRRARFKLVPLPTQPSEE